jgi:hypothetical protein
MGRTKIVLTLTFLLTLGAGLVAGLLVARWPAEAAAATTMRTDPSRTALGAELGLTREQTVQMHDIWEGVRDKVDACFVRAHDIQERRDRALVALLSEEQRAKYARAQAEYADAIVALKAERDAMFQDGVKRTEQILNESQRRRYRQILDARLVQDAANAPPDWIAPQPPATRPAAAGDQGNESRRSK